MISNWMRYQIKSPSFFIRVGKHQTFGYLWRTTMQGLYTKISHSCIAKNAVISSVKIFNLVMKTTEWIPIVRSRHLFSPLNKSMGCTGTCVINHFSTYTCSNWKKRTLLTQSAPTSNSYNRDFFFDATIMSLIMFKAMYPLYCCPVKYR